MPLNAGTRLGPYEIVAPLGAGGMGEVYRARDTRLGREVAIKVLPQHLSANPEVRARFEREARTVSGLNHPNVCTLFDVGREGDTDFLVMELIDGETLGARLTRGPLPYADVLRIGGQIADALDRAHRSGVVHRDLKPGNVMLTRSGAKLMDFGLARAAASGSPVSASGATLGALTQSPTLVSPLTAEGAIVGTFQYMSPEQLEGREADARSDLWSFGAMLYEMATGRRAFEGRSQASLIAAILEREPAPMTSSPSTPGSAETPLAALEPLVRACLAKDPEERVQTAHDVKLQLRWLSGASSTSTVTPSGTGAAMAVAPRRPASPLPWIVAAAAVLVALGLGALLLFRPAAPRAPRRFTIGPPATIRTMTWPRLSPDGRVLAFTAVDTSGVPRIWIRPLDALEATPLAGTEGAGRPFWSPDSRWIGYFANSRLVRIAVAGGPPQIVAENTGGFDGAWGSRNVVVYDASSGDSIRSVAISGGAPRPASRLDHGAGEVSHNWPVFLPDGRHFLCLADIAGKPSRLRVFTIGSNESRDLGPVGSRVEYAPPGYLLWVANDVLLARPFDAKGLRFTGDAFPVASGASAFGSRANLTVSNEGTLVFADAGAQGQNRLIWVDRAGKLLGQAGPPGNYGDIALSPDGRRLAYDQSDASSGQAQIWVRDLVRDVTSRFSFGPGNAIWPLFSPDGRTIVYSSDRKAAFSLYFHDASGTGSDSLVRLSNENEGATDWTGGLLVVGRYQGARGDIDVIEPRPNAPRHPVIATDANEQFGHLSPDGHWLVYVSNESGKNEVFVQNHPPSGGKWQISTHGGTMPQWRGDGREIFYYGGGRDLQAVSFQPGPSPEIGLPVTLFSQVLAASGIYRTRYVATSDGQRFLLNVPPAGGAAGFTVVENWTSGIARK